MGLCVIFFSSSAVMSCLFRGERKLFYDAFRSFSLYIVCVRPPRARFERTIALCEESHRVVRKREAPNDQWNLWLERNVDWMMTWKHRGWCIICLQCYPLVNESCRDTHGERFSVYISLEIRRKWLKSRFSRIRVTEHSDYNWKLHNSLQNESYSNSPRPFLSRLMLLYPPPPMLSSSRSRHSIVVLNSYEDDPNMTCRLAV